MTTRSIAVAAMNRPESPLRRGRLLQFGVRYEPIRHAETARPLAMIAGALVARLMGCRTKRAMPLNDHPEHLVSDRAMVDDLGPQTIGDDYGCAVVSRAGHVLMLVTSESARPAAERLRLRLLRPDLADRRGEEISLGDDAKDPERDRRHDPGGPDEFGDRS